MWTSLWPQHDAPEPWQGVVCQVYGNTPGRRLLWTPARGGTWLTSSEVLFPDAACLQDAKAPEQQGQGGGGLGPLGRALLALDVPLAGVTPDVLTMMLKHLVSE